MVEKYKKLVLIIVLILTLIINLILLDLFILPKKTIKDTIVSYNKLFFQGKFGNKSLISYHFTTHKGFDFSTERYFINEDKISISYTPIFRNVTKVRSDETDYSNKLISDLNQCYFKLLLIYDD